MYALSQDSSVTSSEELKMKRESPAILPDKTTLVDSSCVDSVGSPFKFDSLDTPSSNLSSIYKSFPWISEFSKLCQMEVGLTKIHALENLMTEYIRNVSTSVLECHMKPKRSAKLKKTMNGTLLLFHFFYSDIKKPLEHSSYLDKMSDLMAMYIDMEITASSRSKESLFKIASKLTTSLFIFLDRSHDHILDAIFKTKYMNKTYWELCNLIFTRVLRESPGRAVCDLTYVRYVLAFKMWKRVVKSLDDKKNIMKMAAAKLHPPPLFRESVKAGIFSGILPKIPKSRSDITMFLMQAKFCIKEKIKAFLKQINTSEKRGALSSYMTNFDRTSFSNNNDTDDSRVSSEEDQEENRGGSTALINNIWSSMSSESGVAHQIRMANIIKGKKQKNKCKKAKCKGIATPVFKTNNTQTCDSAEKLKKKRRLQEISEFAAVKPLSTSLLTEKCSNQSNITVVRPRIESPIESPLQVSVGETCQSPSVVNIKNEPVDTEISVDVIKTSEQVNRVDSIFPENQSDKLAIPEERILTNDVACSTPVWRDSIPTPCEPVYRTADRLLPEQDVQPKDDCVLYQRDLNQDLQSKDDCVLYQRDLNQDLQPKDDCVLYQRDLSQEITAQEITAAKSLINFSQSSQVPRDPKQEFIKETVARIQESGRGFYKSHIKLPKAGADQQLDQNLKSEHEAIQEKCKGMLHDQTLRRDFKIFTSQHMFRSNLLNNTIPPETTVPSPFHNDDGSEEASRCNCVQCTANQTALVTNYKTLTQYMENKQKVASEKIQDPDPASCLPFKKRKTVSVEKEEDEQDGKTTPGTRDDEVSYPSTPMISIAMIDPKVQPLVSNTTPLFPPAIDYSVSTASSNYDPQPNSFIVPSVEQNVQAEMVTSVDQQSYPMPQAYHSSDYKPKFKTPAQLKECPIPRSLEEPSVAQNLNGPANNKRKPNSQSYPRTVMSQKKTKTKVDRNLRKRK